MATIRELLKSKKDEVYGKVSNIIISSKGTINPPRGAALLASSPTSLGSAIGNQIGALVKSSANRPTDTIFENDKFTSKPISLKNTADIVNAVEKGKEYFVKQSPNGNKWYSTFEQGTGDISALKNNALGAARKAAAIGVDKLKTKLSKKGGGGNQTDKNKEKPKIAATDSAFEYYKPGKFNDWHNNKSGDKAQKYTGWVRNDDGKLEERKENNIIYANEKSKFDLLNSSVLENLYYKDDKSLKNDLLDKIDKSTNQTVVVLKPHGKEYSIVLPGTITGISEDASPDYTDFKYVGSPFKVYKYLGVERTLKFELKMYYNTQDEKKVMIDKINSIRELVFPYDEITSVTYNGQTQPSQLAFSGNFVNVSIGGLYQNLFTIVDSLGISIEDNVPWIGNGTDDKPYPSIVNVSFGFKIIEKHSIVDSKKTNIKRFNYNFDGVGTTISNKINSEK